jgi:hypothetical protein
MDGGADLDSCGVLLLYHVATRTEGAKACGDSVYILEAIAHQRTPIVSKKHAK